MAGDGDYPCRGARVFLRIAIYVLTEKKIVIFFHFQSYSRCFVRSFETGDSG